MDDLWLALLLAGIVFAIGLWIGYAIWRWKQEQYAAVQSRHQRNTVDASGNRRSSKPEVDDVDNGNEYSDPDPHRAQSQSDNASHSGNNHRYPQLSLQNDVVSQQTFAELPGIRATRNDSLSRRDAGKSPIQREFKPGSGAPSRSYISVDGCDRSHGSDNQDNNEQLIVSVLLLPKSGQSLDGSLLITAMEAQGMCLGKMQIYHCYDRTADISGTVLFSAALTIEPGTINPVDIQDASIPGVALFMQLPPLVAPEVALQTMLQTAKLIANRLNAVVCDDRGSRLSPQSVSYMHECIGEFVRRQLLL